MKYGKNPLFVNSENCISLLGTCLKKFVFSKHVTSKENTQIYCLIKTSIYTYSMSRFMSKHVFYNKLTKYYRFNCNTIHCYCFHYIYKTKLPVNQSEIQKTSFLESQLICDFITLKHSSINTRLTKIFFYTFYLSLVKCPLKIFVSYL